MRVYIVETEEVANVMYQVRAETPEQANHQASLGLGTVVDRWVSSREVVSEAELDD